jgi:hypothetical protein
VLEEGTDFQERLGDGIGLLATEEGNGSDRGSHRGISPYFHHSQARAWPSVLGQQAYAAVSRAGIRIVIRKTGLAFG